MSNTLEANPNLDVSEAILIVERGLSDISSRELVSTGEVADILLDVRTILTGLAIATDRQLLT
jgi:hypothetical protein